MNLPDEILSKLTAAETPDEAASGFHFHGTCGVFKTPLRPSGYDGCLWLATEPTVAQCYIPTSPTKMAVVMERHELDERVRPQFGGEHPTGLYEIALRLGFPPAKDINVDHRGEASSWTMPSGYPRKRQLVEKLAEMGYDWDGGSFKASLKMSHGDDGAVIHPRDHRMPGRLFVVDGVDDLELYDLAASGDGDLLDPDYHKVDLFRKLEAQGFDGITINDFAQSEIYGNVGHLAVGVFPHALRKLRYGSVEARHWEWDPDGGGLSVGVTPEFVDLHRAARAEVINGMVRR